MGVQGKRPSFLEVKRLVTSALCKHLPFFRCGSGARPPSTWGALFQVLPLRLSAFRRPEPPWGSYPSQLSQCSHLLWCSHLLRCSPPPLVLPTSSSKCTVPSFPPPSKLPPQGDQLTSVLLNEAMPSLSTLHSLSVVLASPSSVLHAATPPPSSETRPSPQVSFPPQPPTPVLCGSPEFCPVLFLPCSPHSLVSSPTPTASTTVRDSGRRIPAHSTDPTMHCQPLRRSLIVHVLHPPPTQAPTLNSSSSRSNQSALLSVSRTTEWKLHLHSGPNQKSRN